MALIKISDELLNNEELFDIIYDSFDIMEKVEQNNNVTTFRVFCDEITSEDKIICPEFISFPGIIPFIIQYDC